MRAGERMRKSLFVIFSAEFLALCTPNEIFSTGRTWQHSMQGTDSSAGAGSKESYGDVCGFLGWGNHVAVRRGHRRALQKEDVVSVRLMKNRHRLLNSMVLGGVGAGAGAGIGAAQHQGCLRKALFRFWGPDVAGLDWRRHWLAGGRDYRGLAAFARDDLHAEGALIQR